MFIFLLLLILLREITIIIYNECFLWYVYITTLMNQKNQKEVIRWTFSMLLVKEIDAVVTYSRVARQWTCWLNGVYNEAVSRPSFLPFLLVVVFCSPRLSALISIIIILVMVLLAMFSVNV